MMHVLLWLLAGVLILTGVGLILPDTDSTAAVTDASNWRRTSTGWERASWLAPPVPYHRPALHPGLVATLEALIGVALMVAVSASRPLRDGQA